ncbi:MAG: aminotransferase class V-fold PLP-dependent enzyme [Pyrinomonadaceae bacterium]
MIEKSRMTLPKRDIDWGMVRRQFPATDSVAYMNTAAAGPLSRATAEAGSGYYLQMMADGDLHWNDWLAKREDVRRKVAAFINAEPDEIGLTTNTSSGMTLIVDALQGRGEVISCDLEFPVSTIPWMHQRIPVHMVQNVAGEVEPSDIRAAMTPKTGIVSLSHVQYSNGFRSNLAQLGQEKGNHTLVVNASQSAGVFEIDVKRMKIDALCATGHKWMLSGYGSGFVYISGELLAETKPRSIGWLSVKDPYGDHNSEINLRRDAAARSELGCPHFAGIFALGASVDFLHGVGMANIQERALSMNRILTNCLVEAGLRVLSPLRDENSRSAETLVAMKNPSQVVSKLAERGVIVTEKPEGIRVATDFFNNEQDIERLIAALNDAAESGGA